MREDLSFDNLIESLHTTSDNLPDYRTGQNTQYTIADAAMGAFSVFFTQSPSFLSHQCDLQRNKGKNNATTIFGIEEIPCDNQIRNLLDPIAPDAFYPLFWSVFDQLKAAGYLKEYTGFSQNLLCSLDGVQYFSSKKLHCKNCRHKTCRDGTLTYSHAAITPVLVSNQTNHVIALEPEFITPQDGIDKQDCEQNAIKRWILQADRIVLV